MPTNKKQGKNGKTEKKGENSNIKWIRANVIVQVIIALLILLSVCKTGENIKQQGKFNRDILRPFLYSTL